MTSETRKQSPQIRALPYNQAARARAIETLTLMQQKMEHCSIPVITLALQRRFRSREEAPFSDKLLAAMRNQFGGHAIKRES